MNKAELITAVAEKTGQSKSATEQSLSAILEVISETMASGDQVSLIGFGTFSTNQRAERQGRNPQTGETMTIKAATLPSFKAGKGLKDRVNQG